MLLQSLDDVQLLLLNLGVLELSLAIGLHLFLLEVCSSLLCSQSLGDLGLANIDNFLALGDLGFLGIKLLLSSKLGLVDLCLLRILHAKDLGLVGSLLLALHSFGLLGRLDPLALRLGQKVSLTIGLIFNLRPGVILIRALIVRLSIGGGLELRRKLSSEVLLIELSKSDVTILVLLHEPSFGSLGSHRSDGDASIECHLHSIYVQI